MIFFGEMDGSGIHDATPKLTVTHSLMGDEEWGIFKAKTCFLIFSARVTAMSASMPNSTMTNSSPPYRAIKSLSLLIVSWIAFEMS